MQTTILGSGEKVINISGPEVVRLTSDQHIRPAVFARLATHALEGTMPVKQDDPQGYRARFMTEYLRARTGLSSDTISHDILDGDFIHTDPHRQSQEAENFAAWDLITQAIEHYDITGANLTMLPGNHSLTSSIPAEDLERLVNRGILVPEGKARIVTNPGENIQPTTMHVRHGHEFDAGKHEMMQFGNSPIAQTILEAMVRAVRKITRVQYFPYGNSVTKAMGIISNAPQMIRAEEGLGDNEWAIDGHTHFPALYPPNGHSPEPEFNRLSKEYLEKVLMDSTLARALLKIASKTIPNLAGIDQWYVTSHNGTGYANTGMWDPVSQIVSGLDIDPNGIALFLANVNGGYEDGMMRQKRHRSISVVERHDFKQAPMPAVEI